jgi:hypothetical protein
MERSAPWLVLLTAIGSILATATTLLQYIQAHRIGQPGGYLPMIFGALAIGLLVAVCGYFAKPQAVRSGSAAVLQGVLASMASLSILFVTLIWGFGS